MQATNICRDVGQDARLLDRIYLPTDWCNDAGISKEDLTRSTIPPGHPRLVERLMQLAEKWYAAALPGIAMLPPGSRTAITAAMRWYREILNEVRRNGYDNLTRRAFVPVHRKALLLLSDSYERRKRCLRAASDPSINGN